MRVLYVSPLQGAGQRRPPQPARRRWPSFSRLFAEAGAPGPSVRVMTRTGDTSQAERRRIATQPARDPDHHPREPQHPAHIGRRARLLGGLRTVILDEIHAVVGSKRGVHLMTAVERLVPLSGELQRIALSATVHPREVVARWVGGRVIEPSAHPASLPPAAGAVVVARQPQDATSSSVALPVGRARASREPDAPVGRAHRPAQAHACARNRSTLIFGNSQRMVEKVARFLNEDEPPAARLLPPRRAVARDPGGGRGAPQGGLSSRRSWPPTRSSSASTSAPSTRWCWCRPPPVGHRRRCSASAAPGHGVGETSRGTPLSPPRSRDLLERGGARPGGARR